MGNLSFDDVHRSLRRYLAVALGTSWSVRMEREVIGDDERPAMVVEASSPASAAPGNPPARRTIPQGDYAVQQSFSATAYPTVYDTAREGGVEAKRVTQLLYDAIAVGLVNDDGSNLGHPMAVPVWDYADVPAVGPDRAGPVEPYAWAWVEDHSARPLQDPLDAKRWTVAMDVRLSWQRAGREAPPAVAGTLVGSWRGEGVP